MPDPEIDIRIKTSADTKALKQTQTEIAATTTEAKKLGETTNATTGFLGKLGARLGSFAVGTVFTAALTTVTVLMSKLYERIKEIYELLQPTERAFDELGNSAKRSAEDAAAAVQKLNQSFTQAGEAAANLRKRQDELGDAELSANLSGIDALEALGPNRGGLTPADAQMRRANLRLNNAREKNERERRAIDEQAKVLKAQREAAFKELEEAATLQEGKEAKLESLLDQGSRVLNVDKEMLRGNPQFFEEAYQKAMSETQPPIAYTGGNPVFTAPPDRARRAELESLEPLRVMLNSPDRRFEKAKDMFSDASAVADQQMPELARRKQMLRLREISTERSSAVDVVGAIDSRAEAENTGLLKQVGGSMGRQYQTQNGLLKQILAQVQAQERELRLLEKRVGHLRNP